MRSLTKTVSSQKELEGQCKVHTYKETRQKEERGSKIWVAFTPVETQQRPSRHLVSEVKIHAAAQSRGSCSIQYDKDA